MRRALAACALAILAGPATAQDIAELYGCTLATAIYRQPTTDWELRFRPLTKDDAINQRNAFTIKVPGSDKVIAGGVYMPNGFTTALGTMDIDCPETDVETAEGTERPPGCGLWQGTVYGDGPQGINELVDETSVPPLQILFPSFASTLWYAYYPAVEFRNIVPRDAFTFAGCTPAP